MCVSLAEGLKHLQALQQVLLALLGFHFVGLSTQAVGFFIKVETGQQVINGLGTHLGDELVRVVIRKILVLDRKHFHQVEILFFGQEFQLGHLTAVIVVRNFLAFKGTALDDHITLIINDGVKLLCRDAQQRANLIGKGAEVPDMGHRNHQRDVSHALTTHFFLRHLDAAVVANDVLVPDALVLSAVAFPVLHRTEDTLTEQAVALGFIGTVVDGLGFQNLTVRTRKDRFGRGQTHRYASEVAVYNIICCHNSVFLS